MQTRGHICVVCGRLQSRSGKPHCTCGAGEMKPLSYEQNVAATRLSARERIDWIASSGKVTRVTGKGTKRWKAVTRDGFQTGRKF